MNQINKLREKVSDLFYQLNEEGDESEYSENDMNKSSNDMKISEHEKEEPTPPEFSNSESSDEEKLGKKPTSPQQ